MTLERQKNFSWTTALTFLWMPTMPWALLYIFDLLRIREATPRGTILLVLFLSAPLVCFAAAVRLAKLKTARALFFALANALAGCVALIPLYGFVGAYGLSKFGH